MRHTLLVAALLAGCSTQTQLVVVVETNLDVPTELDSVEVSVLNPDGVSTVTPQPLVGPDAPSFPLTLGVVPGGDALGPITVTATGRLGGVEVVRQRAEVTLVPGETRTLLLVLYRSCAGRECAASATCDAAGCVGLERPDLPAWTGTPPTFDDSDPCLAMRWDVDGDGEGSLACGGTDCDDDEPLASAGATEDCDSIDNDCDGMTDEGCGCAPLDAMEECATSCGAPGDRVCTAMGWTACAPRAEVCNGTDDDCDGLTDEAFDYVPSAPVALTEKERASLDPDVIWTGDRYAMVWHDDIDDRGVYFRTLDASGAPMMDPLQISDEGRMPAIAWSGSTYGVLWWSRETVICGTDCTLLLDRMYFEVLGPDGAILAGPERVEPDAANEPRPNVVWDGTSFVLGYRGDDPYLEARDEMGDRVGPRISVPVSREATFDLVFTGSRFALAYASGNSDAYFTQGDLAAFPPTDIVVGTFDRPESPSMVWTGDGFLMGVGTRSRLLADGTLSLVVLDAAGAPQGTPTTLTSRLDRSSPFGGNDPPGMAMGLGEAVVVWPDAAAMAPGLRFVRVAPDGSSLQAATPLPGLGGSPHQTSVAWSGTSYGVVWVEEPASGSEQLVFSRLACP